MSSAQLSLSLAQLGPSFLLVFSKLVLPIPGEAKAKAMPGRLYIHTRNKINNNNKPLLCHI
jgi:hypothetical protein